MLRRHALVAGLVVTCVPRARAQAATLRLGTTPEGGGFAPYTVALTETLRSVDPGLVLRAIDTRGSTDNAQRLKAGTVDIGLVSGEVLHDSETQQPGRLKVVSAMYYAPGMFGVLGNSRAHAIADLKGRPVVWGPRGTGSAVQARYVMDGLGLDIDSDFASIYPAKFTEGPALLFEGKAAAVWGAGMRQPSFVKIAEYPVGVRFIVPSAAEIARIRGKHPFLMPLTVPAGTYPGMKTAIATIGTWSFIVARPDLDDAVVQRFVTDLHEAEKLTLKPAYMALTTAENTVAGVTSPSMLHPAALKYFQELGLIR